MSWFGGGAATGSSSPSGSSGQLRKSASKMSLKKMGSQIFSSKKNSEAELSQDTKAPHVVPIESTSVVVDDLKWALEPSSTTEGQTFYMTLDNGGFMFVQAVYSTMGLSPSVQLTTKIYNLPGNKEKSKALSHGGGAFRVSEDRLSVDCEQISINFDWSTKEYNVTFNAGADCSIDFKFIPESDFFKVNDGKFLFTGDPSGGYVNSQFLPRAKIVGTLKVDGETYSMDGLGFFIHAIQFKPQCIGKWNFINLQGPDTSLMLYEFEMPPDSGYAFDIISVGAIVRDKKLLAVTLNNRAIHTKRDPDDFSGYLIPEEISLNWKGETLTDKKPVKVGITQTLQNLYAKIDVLSELPFLLRKFIQTFITAPFLYQWVEDVKTKLVVGDEELEVTGRVLVETTFLMQMN
ncbi:putative cell survival pathways protein [Phlyctochytrium bullatum]|nr:putative cell survival pathways protein [Phlyctochytrium bullatum]